jgi:transcriptional regulator with XRE-family HTH domain
MKTDKCGNCGEDAAIVRRDYPSMDMGIPVVLENIEVIECSHCGNVDPIIPNIDGLMLVLAMAVICNPRKLCGEEVRFLRKYVGKSAADFSRFLHVDSTHLSKIENNKLEIGKRLDKLVRLLVCNMSLELSDGIQNLMRMIPNIEDSCSDGVHSLQVNPQTMDCHYATA